MKQVIESKPQEIERRLEMGWEMSVDRDQNKMFMFPSGMGSAAHRWTPLSVKMLGMEVLVSHYFWGPGAERFDL